MALPAFPGETRRTRERRARRHPSLTLPARLYPAKILLMELAHARPAGPAPADKVRLLIIDDNRALAETMAETLADVGYDCETATTSAEGARKIDSETFD